MENHKVFFEDKGLVPYKECWDYQLGQFHEMTDRKKWNKLNPELEKATESRLIFCSHPHVYTLGKSGKEENLLLTESELKFHGAEFYHINRGGDITYHGPGQIEAGRGPKGFTGVWIDWENPEKARKICAFGMHTSRWVTMHGFALNGNTDLAYYKHIIPCGIDDKAITSMQTELGKQINEQEVKDLLKSKIALELNIQEFA
jgi:lipoyl(octanoyl) transferase